MHRGAWVERITTTKAQNQRSGQQYTPACARTCTKERNFKVLQAYRTEDNTFQLVAKALGRFDETGPKKAGCRTITKTTPPA
mmetsp:Transcript_1546/g.9523  ORF Transcript_1546/g.9523 Transcript_1546/m.9523 type:complete len:82 (+) Transcript_1546:148-393(+)